MNNVHGLIFAYRQFPDLGELGKYRTAAALPFCGRYRLIDFALSGMMNAGMHNVDIILQFRPQSLMDHVGAGKPWNMARLSGGIRLRPDQNEGTYNGDMEAMEALRFRIADMKEDYVLMVRGNLAASIDVEALTEAHLSSGADVTAVCTSQPMPGEHMSFVAGSDGFAADLLLRQTDNDRGLPGLGMYLLGKERLLQMIDWSAEGDRLHFHRDALLNMMREGWKVGLYRHDGYARLIENVPDYFAANLDMLDPEKRAGLFPASRPVATRARSDVSTYYSDTARVSDSMIADGCIIEGAVDHCIIGPGVHVEPGAKLRNCIILNNSTVGAGTVLKNVITEKDVVFGPTLDLSGSETVPLVIPKHTTVEA